MYELALNLGEKIGVISFYLIISQTNQVFVLLCFRGISYRNVCFDPGLIFLEGKKEIPSNWYELITVKEQKSPLASS